MVGGKGRTVEWAGVRERVLALRGEVPHRRGFLGFGARRPVHGPGLWPPLTEEQLAEAETELGIALPPSYRSFLREVGAGGAGPYHLFPLRRDADGWHWYEVWGRGDGSRLDRALPPAEERMRLMRENEDREPLLEDFPSEQAYRTAHAAWAPEDDELELLLTSGAVLLASMGCGELLWLVVTGPDRGTLVSDLGAGSHRERLQAVDFGDWYRAWLDRAAANVSARSL